MFSNIVADSCNEKTCSNEYSGVEAQDYRWSIMMVREDRMTDNAMTRGGDGRDIPSGVTNILYDR